MNPSKKKTTTNHWKDIVTRYEKRNASLEQRQEKLSERLRAMECALPSILMSAMVSMHRGTDPPKIDLESILSKVEVTTGKSEANSSRSNPESCQVELVYKRPKDAFDYNHRNPEQFEVPEEAGIAVKKITTPEVNSRFATGDNGRLNYLSNGNNRVSFAQESSAALEETSIDDANLSVISSQDLMALGRIQELAEQERLLKRYICDLESREKTFCEMLEKANRQLNDPLDCLECVPICPGAEAKEPLSDDPVMQRLQKLEFYNKKMITSMKGLRQEKNFLIKQTEMLKEQLRSTQEKLGEVQKEVLGTDKVIPVMGEVSFTEIRNACSCASTTNKESSSVKNGDQKTLMNLAEQFEDVLQKAKNHGLCKLSGSIKDAAVKLKQLSESEEGYKSICNCPCDSTVKQDGPCWNCKCGKFDVDKLGETGDWFCDSCGGECVCDLISLDEDSLEINEEKINKVCECGCENDKIACECGCGIIKVNEFLDVGDIPKKVARKLSEELGGIICKDCGNCKCGDDHSKCPGCVEACTCSCTRKKISKSLLKTESQTGIRTRERQDLNVCGPRCTCSDSEDEIEKKLIAIPREKENLDIHPCFDCEQSEPCDVCYEEEFNRFKQIEKFNRRQLLPAKSTPCEQCLKFDTKSIKNGVRISSLCNLCQIRVDTVDQPRKIELIKEKDDGSGDNFDSSKLHDPNCPCSCNEMSSNPEQCLCGCGVSVKITDKVENNSCPCGCGQVVEQSEKLQESSCDCECAKNGIHCDYCCCVDSVLKILKDDQLAHKKSPKTCPCIEDSIREAEMDRLAKTLQDDVDSIERKNNILRQLIAQCACASPEIMEDLNITDGCPYHDFAPIRPTISGLQAAIELLRMKNRRKDGMIAVLAENLYGKIDAGKVIETLAIPTLPDTAQDFDQQRLFNYLKRSDLSQSWDESTPTQIDEGKNLGEALRIENSELFDSENGIPAPRDFKVVRQICDDCLLVTWTQPEDISALNGYELLVNGYLVNRVRSPTRTEALLVSLDTSRPVILTLYSIGPGGSCSKPVRITYPFCPCIND